jgi:hypothetical protein
MLLDKQFVSLDENHQINISIINNIAWFEIKKLKQEEYKTFVYLFKEVIEYFNKNNIISINQVIDKESVKYCKLSEIKQVNENLYEINTKLRDFVDEVIVNLLGIQRI